MHVVGLSGGKDSTAMALRLAEIEPRDYVYICTPTDNEPPEMFEHWRKLEQLLGRPIQYLRNGTLESWIDFYKALPNFRMRWCTRQLKIEPTIAFLLRNQPVTHYVGLRIDEEEREGIYGAVAAFTKFPMREWGWTIKDVWAYLREREIEIPRRTDCMWCYHQRLGDWKWLWKTHPVEFAKGAALEQTLGYTFRSPGRDTWPVDLLGLAAEFRKGRKIRGEDKEVDPEMQSCRVCRL